MLHDSYTNASFQDTNDSLKILVSSNNETKELDIEVSETAKCAVFVAGVLLILVGITGNFSVIWIIFKEERLRATYNLFVVNLMVTDTILLGYLLPFNISTFIHGHFPLDYSVCVFNGIISNLCFPSSILTLMNIAIDRYFIVCQYKRHDKLYTVKVTTLIIISSWLVGPLVSLPALFGVFDFEYDPVIRTCLFSRYTSKAYTMFFLASCIGVPITVICVCYAKVFLFLKKARKNLTQSWNNGLTRKRFLENIRITYSLCVIFIVHMVFYLPFGIVAVFGDGNSVFPSEFHHAANFLCFANSGINSILYGVLNSNIRKAIINCLCCEPKVNRVKPDIENKLTPNSNKLTPTLKVQWIKVTNSSQELIIINNSTENSQSQARV